MTRRHSWNRIRWSLHLCALLIMFVLWIGQVSPAQSQGTFTGRSFRVESEGISTTSRGFEPSARTHWHSHSAQLLFVRVGQLRYQVQGGSITEIGLHETAYLPRGIMHWHGATPGQALTHVSVTFPNEAGERLSIAWGAPVSDAEYEGQ